MIRSSAMKFLAEARPDWPESWRLSHHYDRLELGPPDRAHLGYQYAYWARRDATLALVERAASPPARVLDVAAAQGNFTLALAERGYRVTWNDLRADLAEYARMKYERGEVEFVAGNILDLVPSDPWDVVVACEVIEHVAHPDRFIEQLAALVEPGGHIVVTTPNGSYFRNRLPRFDVYSDQSVFEAMQFKPDADGHIFLLHQDELRAMAVKSGLELVDVKVLTNPLTNGSLGLGSLLPFVPRVVVSAIERATRALPAIVTSRIMATTVALLRRPHGGAVREHQGCTGT